MSDYGYNDLEGAADLSESALLNLQCNILRSTGRGACDHVFHRFTSKQAFVGWLKNAPLPSHSEAIEPTLVNVLFTRDGLSRLGVSPVLLGRMDPAFRRGTRNPVAYKKLRDPLAALWEKAHRKSWDVVELHWRPLGQKAVQVASSGREHEVHTEEGQAFGRDGKVLRRDDEPRYNHFGIMDGNSNPVFTRRDYEALVKTHAPAPGWKWDPRHKLSAILVADPLAQHPGCYGSYFVFRKYAQDVSAFRSKLANVTATIAKLLEAPEEAWRWGQYPAFVELGSKAFATLSDGLRSEAALHRVLSSRAGVVLMQTIFGVGPDGQRPTGGTDNNFDYRGDPEGKKCPFSAHARAVNARGARQALGVERRTTIARRGISYKDGSFFWCAQASIGEQFEYIQEKWANGSSVDLDHHPSPGVDYVIGQPSRDESSAADEARSFSLDVRDTIKLRASEYLFAPSLVGFQRLQAMGGVQ